MELKKLKEKNKKVMKRLRELAQTDIEIWSTIERAFLEVQITKKIYIK